MTRRTALLAGLLLPGCDRRQRVEAGGATSFAPLVLRWAAEYRRLAGVEIDYLTRGSGYGVAQVAAGSLAFGVTDDPPTAAERDRAAAAGRRLGLVPLAVGAVAVVHNLPGLADPLTLSGPVLADLFAGHITRWDDPVVAALNPGVPLPPLAVRPVVRAEASGTTATFTGYLLRAGPGFSEVGGGRKPHWPAGAVGQEGSDGVTGFVRRTPGAVGYVEGRYARRAGLAAARVVNRRGQAVPPDPAGVTAADGRPDADAAGAYPVVGLGYAVVPGDPDPAAVGFLRWAVTDGQSLCATDYAPLPARLVEEAKGGLAPVS
jgi:phosphate transport system substrate-binding protein